jgi:hypothetical protein
MNQGSTIFSQLIAHASRDALDHCIRRYRGNHRVRTFSCRDPFLVMAFAQLTYRESRRDIGACLNALPDRLYHMGIRGRVSRSTLADANEERDWRIYADFTQGLIAEACRLCAGEPLDLATAAKYPEHLRRVRFKDLETGKSYVFTPMTSTCRPSRSPSSTRPAGASSSSSSGSSSTCASRRFTAEVQTP